MSEINIQDESGDKKYFTTIPNYIANHSTANDQALYFQMKRYAGENGKCFATQETIMKKMGVGRKAYNKSLKYLLKKKWIKFIGISGGKTRPIKTYAIVDIWKINIMEYEKIPAERTVSFQKIPAESNGDTGQKNSKIPAERTVEEEPYKQEHINKNLIIAASAAKNELNVNKSILLKKMEIPAPIKGNSNKQWQDEALNAIAILNCSDIKKSSIFKCFKDNLQKARIALSDCKELGKLNELYFFKVYSELKKKLINKVILTQPNCH